MNDKPLPYGGWLINTSNDLSKQNHIDLSIAFPNNKDKELRIFQGEKIKYYSFPKINPNNHKDLANNHHIANIIEMENPDIVHIFGTEGAHCLATVNLCKKKNITAIISIQGLISIYAKHYLSNIPSLIQNKYTLRDLLKKDNLIQQQKKMVRRGKLEIEALENVCNVIGRTTWDKACSTIINPDVNYHFCNETLRQEFYRNRWDIDSCEKYSIFISQGQNPIKGLHFMLEALSIIVKKFPNTVLYIGGENILKSDTLKSKLKLSSYAKYCESIIKDKDLYKNIVFTGVLNEKEICNRYLKSNVFVCPSSIENSPNSLGEAMILGVPCVASDVGGVTDMLTHNVEGYVYQPDASYMLAYYINEIFINEGLASAFSIRARERALQTHDKINNTSELIRIYNKIKNITAF